MKRAKMKKSLVLCVLPLLLLFLSMSCGGGGGGASSASTAESKNETSASLDTSSSSDEVTYVVTFQSEWSAATHPNQFPTSAHFSGLIGLAHNEKASIWSTGELASTGIKNMAETGSKFPLTNEISDLIASGNANVEISGGGLGTSPSSVSVTFSTNSQFPLVSLVSMIAPSPDWFIGVSSANLLENGAFLSEKRIDLFPYDSGTDSGTTYTSANDVTNPAENIQRITSSPFLSGSELKRLGEFVFIRQ